MRKEPRRVFSPTLAYSAPTSKSPPSADTEAGYQGLYDALLDQAGVEPGPVGELKRKPRERAKPLAFGAGSSPAATASPPSPSPASPTAQTAVDLWREKLAFLLIEEVDCVDPGQKFRLQRLIAEAREKIRALGGGA